MIGGWHRGFTVIPINDSAVERSQSFDLAFHALARSFYRVEALVLQGSMKANTSSLSRLGSQITMKQTLNTFV